MRWADLTLRFQALSKNGIQPVRYALDRALAYRASRESRAMLHELAQRMFPQIQHTNSTDRAAQANSVDYSGKAGIAYLTSKLRQVAQDTKISVVLRKNVPDPNGSHTKDWIGEVYKEGFNLRFGKTDNVNQNRFYPTNDCFNNDPLAELERRASKKMLEGYSLIPDLCTF